MYIVLEQECIYFVSYNTLLLNEFRYKNIIIAGKVAMVLSQLSDVLVTNIIMINMVTTRLLTLLKNLDTLWSRNYILRIIICSE